VETVEIYNLHRSTLFRSDFTEFQNPISLHPRFTWDSRLGAAQDDEKRGEASSFRLFDSCFGTSVRFLQYHAL
jgi:hypothetical protein